MQVFWSSLLGCVYQKFQSKYLEAKFPCWTSRDDTFKQEPRELHIHISES